MSTRESTPARSPINILIDQIDMRCTCCGAKRSDGCDCWNKDEHGNQLYACPLGCYKCFLHCHHDAETLLNWRPTDAE